MQCPGHGGVWEAIMSQKGVQWVSKGRLLIFSFDVCFGSISLQTAACDDQHSHRILLDALNQTFPLNSAGLVFRFICYSYRFYYLDYFQNWKSLFEVCSSLTMVGRSRKHRGLRIHFISLVMAEEKLRTCFCGTSVRGSKVRELSKISLSLVNREQGRSVQVT